MAKKLTTEDFIVKAVLLHPNKYDYSKVKYVNCNTDVCIICKIHGEFWQKPTYHLSGCGCPICGGTLKLNANSFIDKANIKHSFKYDYTNLNYINNKTKVLITCPIHGNFSMQPMCHLEGQGCPICGNNNRLNLIKSIEFENFLYNSNIKHNKKYDYSMVNYINGRTKVRIICPIHGDFWQTPCSHLSGRGCPSCAGLKKLTTNEFIEKSKLIHGDRYDYTKVNYTGTHEKVLLICEKHGEFKQEAKLHMYGANCPICANEINVLENRLLESIRNKFPNITVETGYKNVWLGNQHIDIFLPKYKIAIEYQGMQHFKPVAWFGGNKTLVNTKIRDLKKYNLCVKNNVKLLYFTYDKNIKIKDYIGKLYTLECDLFAEINNLIVT